MDAKEAAPFDIRNGPDDDFLPPVGGGSSSDTTVSAAGLPAAFAYPRGAYAAVLKRAEPGRPGRVRVRSLAARAAAVLLAAVAALLALPLQAQAQTVSTLVSNLNQGNDESSTRSRPTAQPFRTGDTNGGYTLSSVEVDSEDAAGDAFTASVCTVDADGFPTSTCTSLTAPSSFAAGVLVFTAPANTVLAKETTYTVYMTIPADSVALDTTGSDDEDSGESSMWSIGDAYHFQNNSNEWATTSSSEAIRIAIKGSPVITDTAAPTVSSAAVDGTSLVITFNETLAPAANLANSAFTVKKTPFGGGEQTVSLSGSLSISGTTVTLTLATGVLSTDTDVKVSYTKPTTGSNNKLEDGAGNEVASFTNQAVTNVAPNNPPVFPSSTAARNVAENSPAGTDVGNAVTATDDDNDTLTYTLEGADAVSFDLVTISGSAQIRTKSGVTYDHETKSSYAVTVKADDSNGGSDTIAVTITVTDVNEPPARPAAPSVSSVANSTTSLSVTWTAPSSTGRPAIDSYDLQYRQGTSGGWTNGPQNVTGTSATISGLTANTLYQVQVRATNNEGDSPWSPSGSGQTNQGTPAPDKAALEALYDATDGAGWTNNSNWKSSSPLGDWYGVTIDVNGRVTDVDLFENNLVGSLPGALGNLAELESLSLGFNSLTGSIPATLGNLSKLQSLDLTGINLTGSIPSQLGNLAELESLYLGLNSLTGSIPATLGNLSKLQSLDLNGNNLTGSIPAALGNLSQLKYLWLQENSLSGIIPAELGSLTNLIQLHLNDNSLSGAIPGALGGLTSLTRLELQNNELTGIPAELGNLTELVYLYLHSNLLSGEIPVELVNLTKLRGVQLQDNTDLTGVIPFDARQTVLRQLGVSNTDLCAPPTLHAYWDANLIYDGQACTMSMADRTFLESLYDSTGGGGWGDSTNWKSIQPLADWYGVETNEAGRVTGLSLPGNGLAGVIPDDLGALTWLETLDLSGNDLTGVIPDALEALIRLRRVDLSGNTLTGGTPSWLGDLDRLEYLDLSDTQLSGSIPSSFTQTSALRTLDVTGTTVCMRPDLDFQNWLDDRGIVYRGDRCERTDRTALARISHNLCDDDGFGGARGVDAGRVPVR